MPLPTAPASYWLDRHGPPFRNEPLAGERSADVAIVGGGIVGASLARALVLMGRHVILLDADAKGRGATGRNAGFLLAEGAETTAEVTRTHGPETAAALRAAGTRTRGIVATLERHGKIYDAKAGSLRLAVDTEEAGDFAATARLVGPPMRLVHPSQLPAAYRGLDFTAGLVDPEDGVVDPLSLLDGILDLTSAIESSNPHHDRRFDSFYGSPVVSIEGEHHAVRVRTRTGSVLALQAVVTTNAWINRLLPSGPFVRPVRAQMLAARVDPVPAWDMPVYADHGADYWRLADDGTVLLGGRRLVGGRTEETDDANPAAPVQPALDALLRRLVGGAARIDVVTRWAGTMGFTADGIPVAGRVPGRDRTWVLGGCNGHGMGWGPGLASMLAEALTGRGDGVPACFDPSRAAVMARR